MVPLFTNNEHTVTHKATFSYTTSFFSFLQHSQSYLSWVCLQNEVT